jgi:hypothetical protein
MRKGFLIYEEMRKYLVMYEEEVVKFFCFVISALCWEKLFPFLVFLATIIFCLVLESSLQHEGMIANKY